MSSACFLKTKTQARAGASVETETGADMATIQELSSLRAPIKEDVLKDVAKMIGSIFKSHAKDEETE